MTRLWSNLDPAAVVRNCPASEIEAILRDAVAEIVRRDAVIGDAYYVLTYLQELAGDDVTRAACQSVRDQIDDPTLILAKAGQS